MFQIKHLVLIGQKDVFTHAYRLSKPPHIYNTVPILVVVRSEV